MRQIVNKTVKINVLCKLERLVLICGSKLFVQQTGMHFVKTFLNKNQGMLMHFPGTLLAKQLSQRCWDAIRSQII